MLPQIWSQNWSSSGSFRNTGISNFNKKDYCEEGGMDEKNPYSNTRNIKLIDDKENAIEFKRW